MRKNILKTIRILLILIGLLFIFAGFSLISTETSAGIFSFVLSGILLIYPIKFILQEKSMILKNQNKTKSNNNFIEENKQDEIIQSVKSLWVKKNNYFYINENEKLLKINTKTYKFSDILDFEMLIDGTSISKGNMGSALTRSLLFGSFIGGATSKRSNIDFCTQLELKIVINDISNPTEYINFMKGFRRVKKNSILYKNASKNINDCASILKIITSKNQ